MTSATPVANGATLPATVEALAATVVVVVVDATAAHLEGAAAADVAATVGDPGKIQAEEILSPSFVLLVIPTNLYVHFYHLVCSVLLFVMIN